MSPHETLLIESTNTLEVSESPPNPHIQFLIMDFPGDVDFAEVTHLKITTPANNKPQCTKYNVQTIDLYNVKCRDFILASKRSQVK